MFLTGHLLGNTLLFKEDGGKAFNEYAKFMTTTPLVKVMSYFTYFCILFHVIYSIVLTRMNRVARPIKYAVTSRSENSLWTSRNMGILGTVVFVFIVLHLRSFWWEMHYGNIPMVEYEGGGQIKNLYIIVVEAFSQLWYVILYVICMLVLAFHLSHGFQSAFQTLGLSHPKYSPFIKKVGMGFAIIVPLLFALMPIYIYLKTI